MLSEFVPGERGIARVFQQSVERSDRATCTYSIAKDTNALRLNCNLRKPSQTNRGEEIDSEASIPGVVAGKEALKERL